VGKTGTDDVDLSILPSCLRSRVTAGAPKKKGTGVARPPIGRDKEEAPQGISDMLPEWMGYGFLYFVSTIPVLIVIVTISILFFSSLS